MMTSMKRKHVEKSATKVFWVIIISSMLTPWIVGLAIKMSLMTQGQPTVPLKYFITMALPLSVWWASPFLVLAVVALISLSKPGLTKTSKDSRLTVIFAAHGFGLIGMVVVFREVFIVWDPVWVFLPVQLSYGAAIIVGSAIGWLFTKAISSR
ncbi:MAG: hypothetical protein ABJK25_02530 [Halieaceae bacterium]